MDTMNLELIEAAQKAWGDGIVRIAAAHKAGDDYVQVAHTLKHCMHMVLHLCSLSRPSLQSSNFVQHLMGRSPISWRQIMYVPKIRVLPIKGWTAVRFENVDVITEEGGHGDGELLFYDAGR